MHLLLHALALEVLDHLPRVRVFDHFGNDAAEPANEELSEYTVNIGETKNELALETLVGLMVPRCEGIVDLENRQDLVLNIVLLDLTESLRDLLL